MVNVKSKTYLETAKYIDEKTDQEKDKLVKLYETKPLDQFDEDIQDTLAPFYNHSDVKMKRVGTIFNGIYTQNSVAFMMSFRICRELIATDTERHGLKSCTDREYNAVIHWLLKNNVLVKIRDQKGRRSAMYELIEPRFLNLLYKSAGKDLVDAKKDKNIEWYDTKNSIKKADKPLTETERRIKERADDILNRSKNGRS